MRQFLKNKLEEIRGSDQKNKKRWLVAISAVTMIVVIGLWLIYLNQIIKSPVTEQLPDTSVGNWQIFKNGLKVVFESVRDYLSSLVSKITSSRIITIEK